VPLVKKTEAGQKLEALAQRAPLSWILPDPYNPASYLAPIGGSVIKFPTKRIGTRAVEDVINKTGTEVMEDWLGRGTYARNQLTGYKSPYFNEYKDLLNYLRNYLDKLQE